MIMIPSMMQWSDALAIKRVVRLRSRAARVPDVVPAALDVRVVGAPLEQVNRRPTVHTIDAVERVSVVRTT